MQTICNSLIFIGYDSSFNGKQSESCFSFEFIFLSVYIPYFSCLHKKSNKRMHKLFLFFEKRKSLTKKKKFYA